MRYFKENGKEFIENGKSRLRVTTMDIQPGPMANGRIAKFFAVNEVLASHSQNPISPGDVLALSFPPTAINASAYEWHRYGPEECQVSVKLNLTRKKKR